LNLTEERLQYLELLSQKFPSPAQVSTEIINLNAILGLPKGTEHFISDIHGEYRLFLHILKNASGSVRRKIFQCFSEEEMSTAEMDELATLIYYPEEKLALLKEAHGSLNQVWYTTTLLHLVQVCRKATSKYTRSKVRKAMPHDFAYIIDELLNYSEADEDDNRTTYVHNIVHSIIEIGSADAFIIAISELIQHAVIDKLHIVGDVFDRGNGAHKVMDTLMEYNNVDIQWGNHDILWMGAAAGNLASIANVIRVSARYDNLDVLEDGYGINLLPLARFAMEVYENSPCKPYQPKVMQNSGVTERDVLLMAQMHKAISVIQFKIEGQMIKRHPEYKMEGRALLEKIDYEKGTIEIDGKDYPLKDADFPTVDPRDPYKLTPGEDQLIRTLQASFLNSDKLQKHIRLLFSKGSMYLIVNSNLMYHASIPMTDEGEFKTVIVDGKPYAGRSLLDKLDRLTREAYFGGNGAKSQQMALDYMWYLWCGPESPFFDKAKMATLERYLIEDKKTHHEEKGAYYKHLDDTKMCSMILSAFGLDPEKSHIISGHVPVKTCKGESPIKAGGKLLMIDGGFSKAYHSETGIAGYTLIYNSHGLQLVQHEPFESAVKAVEEGKDIISTKVIVEATTDRITVRDTTIGKELQVQIDDLKNLLAAYRSGQIKERK
jgi:fructose-1,6-bisphosphatase-3